MLTCPDCSKVSVETLLAKPRVVLVRHNTDRSSSDGQLSESQPLYNFEKRHSTRMKYQSRLLGIYNTANIES